MHVVLYTASFTLCLGVAQATQRVELPEQIARLCTGRDDDLVVAPLEKACDVLRQRRFAGARRAADQQGPLYRERDVNGENDVFVVHVDAAVTSICGVAILLSVLRRRRGRLENRGLLRLKDFVI